MIAMFVVGGILLIAFGIYEWFFAANPILPMRILNRAFVCGVIIGPFPLFSNPFFRVMLTNSRVALIRLLLLPLRRVCWNVLH